MADEADKFRETQPGSPTGPPSSWPPRPEPNIPNVWKRRMAMSEFTTIMHNFEDDRVRTFVIGGWPVGVNFPNSGMSAWPSRTTGGTPLPKGGSGMLTDAMARCFEEDGGVLLLNKGAERLIIEGGKCVGVECVDGSTYRAEKAVLSTVHVKRLVDMAPKEMWGEDFLEGVSTFDTGSAGLNTHYATTEPLTFPVKGGTVAPVHMHILWNPARCLRFDMELHTGEVDLEEPVLHPVQPSAADPTRAPAGMHTVRILGRQPYNLADGGPERWDEIKGEGRRRAFEGDAAVRPEFYRRQDTGAVYHESGRYGAL